MVFIKGCEGKYSITESGDIYNHKRKIFMKMRYDKDGYKRTNIVFNNGKQGTVKPHRLVAEEYLIQTVGYDIVNHIDGDKLNNHTSNLEWCTIGHNNKHAYDIGLTYMGKRDKQGRFQIKELR